jgi:hypothetical protein
MRIAVNSYHEAGFLLHKKTATKCDCRCKLVGMADNVFAELLLLQRGTWIVDD